MLTISIHFVEFIKWYIRFENNKKHDFVTSSGNFYLAKQHEILPLIFKVKNIQRRLPSWFIPCVNRSDFELKWQKIVEIDSYLKISTLFYWCVIDELITCWNLKNYILTCKQGSYIHSYYYWPVLYQNTTAYIIRT